MSTIHNTPERRSMNTATLAECIRWAHRAHADAGVQSPPSADALLAAGVELYRLEHWLNDRDTHDEQMSGIADSMDRISNSLGEIGQELCNLHCALDAVSEVQE